MENGTGRRGFLKTVALAGAAPAAGTPQTTETEARSRSQLREAAPPRPPFPYPHVYAGRQLSQIAFPLGGVAAGSLSLGGRGQFRDWEIFNRADKGNAPEYAFPAIWARVGKNKPVARVLEARIAPPYQGATGLGSKNVPGLHRLEGATFTGEYPLARIDFQDRRLPVKVTLEAFSPFIPLDAEESGLPVAVLRYRVRNPGGELALSAVSLTIDNPVGPSGGRRGPSDSRTAEFRQEDGLAGLFMSNAGLPETDTMRGSFALCVLHPSGGKLTYLRGWPRGKWWASPMLYWDDFTADGALGPEPEAYNAVGSLCLQHEIKAGATADFTFLLSWHFPNRTPEWSGWAAPKGEERTVIGNHYCVRFRDAWEAARHTASNLAMLERRTRSFVAAMRETSLPPAIKEAAMANLSTLAATTCFRTADGRFHGFEGTNDQRGCCFGDCTHVWAYEAATCHLFPMLARSMRESAFELSAAVNGAMPIRQQLPPGKQTAGFPAADGQMGHIVKAYIDWRLSGDTDWLRSQWPRVRRALEFAWIPGGWDADRDGVMEGVQHNTYDVEFYGPNPMCGIYYLAGLRAGEEMARALGENDAAEQYRGLFTRGSKWIDENLFNGRYYIQKVQGMAQDRIAEILRSRGGAEDPEHPDFQLAEGCLVDQLVGQYLAQVAGLGHLTAESNIRKTLQSIYRYNYKRTMVDHESVQRIFALNDEAAMVICDYGAAERPRVPFPYYAEVMTGFEYSAAVLMLYEGMVKEGIECIENIRRRYDGERRNPWDEAECGHHYARAMAAWSAIPALSGFRYHGVEKTLSAEPLVSPGNFRSFWSTGTGWGTFTRQVENGRVRLAVMVTEGELPCRSVEVTGTGAGASAVLGGKRVAFQASARGKRAVLAFAEEIRLKPGDRLTVTA